MTLLARENNQTCANKPYRLSTEAIIYERAREQGGLARAGQ